MNRNIVRLTEKEYDLVIVGAGIYGICAAWDAALRGLSVAIVDRGDFCGETSANPLKIVHGGFRYMQAANISRIRASSRERNTLMKIAPHLVAPLPFVIPTYGHGMKGKGVLTLGLVLYNAVVFDRNGGQKDPHKRIPWGKLFSKDETLCMFPALDPKGLTGAVAFYDAQMYSPPRLAMSYLRSAVEAGADALNYAEVRAFVGGNTRVSGVMARDVFTGSECKIRGTVVLNATGPWSAHIVRPLGITLAHPLTVTKDLYLIAGRSLSAKYSIAIPSSHKEPTAVISRGMRHFFVIPWRGRSLIGSSHVVYNGNPDQFKVTDQDIQNLIDEVNESYPALGLTRDDVTFFNSGLVPYGDYYGEHSRVIDHSRDHGVDGLITVTGVRYTTSRGVAKRIVDLAASKIGKAVRSSKTATTPIFGGDITCFEDFTRQIIRQRPHGLREEVIRPLLRMYGSRYWEVLKYADENPALAGTVGESTVLKAEVVHAVRDEMAQTLSDVVFRRTELGTAGHPGDTALQDCARLMAVEMGWGQARIQQQLEEVGKVFPWRSRLYS